MVGDQMVVTAAMANSTPKKCKMILAPCTYLKIVTYKFKVWWLTLNDEQSILRGENVALHFEVPTSHMVDLYVPIRILDQNPGISKAPGLYQSEIASHDFEVPPP